jgi:serine protease Do
MIFRVELLLRITLRGLPALVAGLALFALPLAADDNVPSLADLVERLQPSVVNISITRHVKTPAPSGNIVSQDSVAEKTVQSSGFFIDGSGVILTNRHVIIDASEIVVRLHDGSPLRASLLAQTTSNDIALLKVDAGKPVPPLKFGNSDLLRPGDPVFIIGNPLGLGSTVTSGIISALDRNTPDSESASFFQIDAALNVGNSGGPIFDMHGEVIGVSTALVTPENGAGSVGLGLAIPANDARFVIDRLLATGRVELGWIGIHVQPVTADVAAALRLPGVFGAIITRVDRDSPAARASLMNGEIVIKVDGEGISGPRALNRKIASITDGSVSRVVIWRGGTEVTVPVTVGHVLPDSAMPKDVMPILATKPRVERRDLGLTLAPLTDAARVRLGLSAEQSGVLVEDVLAESAAWDRGITSGSAILMVDGHEVTSGSDVFMQIDEARRRKGDSVLVLIEDAHGRSWTALPLSSAP